MIAVDEFRARGDATITIKGGLTDRSDKGNDRDGTEKNCVNHEVRVLSVMRIPMYKYIGFDCEEQERKTERIM